jgi:release factor glutamine methyltransferase
VETVQSLLQKTNLDRVDARILLHHVCHKHLAWSREMLIAHDQDPLPDELVQDWLLLEKERKNGWPIAYLIKKRSFHQIELYVNEHVLIPRPDTEILVDAAISIIANRLRTSSYSYENPLKVIDLGTGSGAIILSIAKHFKSYGLEGSLELTGSDISQDALQVAMHNRQQLELPFVQLIQSDWFSAALSDQFDLILSNPPYIASNDHHLLEGDLRFEPSLALSDGADGLTAYRRIFADGIRFLRPDGFVMVEHGFEQGQLVRNLFTEQGYSHIETKEDLSGNERMTMGQFLV